MTTPKLAFLAQAPIMPLKIIYWISSISRLISGVSSNACVNSSFIFRRSSRACSLSSRRSPNDSGDWRRLFIMINIYIKKQIMQINGIFSTLDSLVLALYNRYGSTNAIITKSWACRKPPELTKSKRPIALWRSGLYRSGIDEGLLVRARGDGLIGPYAVPHFSNGSGWGGRGAGVNLLMAAV